MSGPLRQQAIYLGGVSGLRPRVPAGVLEMVDDDADLAVARAARAEGVPMILSNQASKPMESVARELGETPHWFQLYWSTSNDLVESLVARAEASDCSAIVVTL